MYLDQTFKNGFICLRFPVDIINAICNKKKSANASLEDTHFPLYANSNMKKQWIWFFRPYISGLELFDAFKLG